MDTLLLLYAVYISFLPQLLHAWCQQRDREGEGGVSRERDRGIERGGGVSRGIERGGGDRQ